MKNHTCVWRNIYNTARATHSRYYKYFAKHACDFSLILLEPCNFLYKSKAKYEISTHSLPRWRKLKELLDVSSSPFLLFLYARLTRNWLHSEQPSSYSRYIWSSLASTAFDLVFKPSSHSSQTVGDGSFATSALAIYENTSKIISPIVRDRRRPSAMTSQETKKFVSCDHR